LADDRFFPDAGEELIRFREAGGQGVLAAAARTVEWSRIASLTELAGVWGALGLHPFFVAEWGGDAMVEELASRIAACPRLRAVGEIGLDFQHGRENADLQEEVFAAQLEVAVRLGLPVVLHNRKSWREAFGILDAFDGAVRGVCHNFTGSPELAREILRRGLHISFAGPVSYPNARRAHAAARYVPSDRILTETDTPDLPPWPRPRAQSVPADVQRVLAAVAGLRGEPVDTLAMDVARNFERLFGGRSPADCA
jgi:TatD DNase family protein